MHWRVWNNRSSLSAAFVDSLLPIMLPLMPVFERWPRGLAASDEGGNRNEYDA